MDEEIEAPLDALETVAEDEDEPVLGDAGGSSGKYTYTGNPSSG